MIADQKLRAALSTLTIETVQVIGRAASPDAWGPMPGSPGDTELKNSEQGPRGAWGEMPVRTSYALAQLLIQTAIQQARAVALVIVLEKTLLVLEMLARGSLEAGATAWWLLEDGIAARRRVCRLQLLRIKSALELERAVKEIGKSNKAGHYGETPNMVRGYSAELGLAPFMNIGRVASGECEGEVRPTYTARVKALLDATGNKGSYNIYSGTSHGELYALLRAFKPSAREPAKPGGPILQPIDDPEGIKAASHHVLLSMIEPLQRAALLFGWNRDESPGAELSNAIDKVVTEMAEMAI